MQGDMGDARDKTDQQAAYYQENRIGYFQFATDHREHTNDK
jgi:hypothetical protein